MEENLQIQESRQDDKYSVGIRELFVLFYLGILGSQILRGYFTSNMMSLLLTGIDRVCAAGMIFAAGCLLGKEDSGQPDFKSKVLKYARNSLFLFWIIGTASELIVYKAHFFWTLKSLLAVTAMPHHAAIFFTLTVLFLICAFGWKVIEKCLEKPWLGILVSVVGMLLTLIPEELVGYALIGAFIGGDSYHCVALFPHAMFFFLGIVFIRLRKKYADQKLRIARIYIGYLIITVVCGGVGIIFYLMGLSNSAWTMLGGAGAIFCSCFSIIILPIYRGCEFVVRKIGQGILNAASTVRDLREDHRIFDLVMYYIGYTILFIVAAYLIFYPFLVKGKTLIWSADALGQYLPKIYRFIEYMPNILRDIFSGNMDFLQYDFHSGLGGTISLTYDPIYWLYLLIKPAQIEDAYSAMIIFRYFLVGASMSACLLYFKKSHSKAYVGSIVYAFSGYAFYAGTRHGQFLTPLILLPLLVVAMERLIRDKKWYLWTILMALSLLCSYYFLYMNVIALGMYFVLRVLCDKNYRSVKLFITRGLMIVGSSLLGFALGSIALATSFGNYVGSSRTEESVSSFLTKTPLFYRGGWIPSVFLSYLSDNYTAGLWLRIGLPPLALLAVILLFTRKNRKELRWLYVILTIFCIFPIFGYAMNGFSTVSNRWSYIYVFLLVFILIENIDRFEEITLGEEKVMLIILGLYAGIVYFGVSNRTEKLLWIVGLLAMTILAVVVLNQKEWNISGRKKRMVFYTITLMATVLNASLSTNSVNFQAQYADKDNSLEQMSQTAFRYFDEFKEALNIDDDTEPFYRSTNLYTYGNTRSSSMIYGYNDVATFNSTLLGGIVDYNRQMGNTDWNTVTVQSYDMRTYMYELASVRFIGSSNRIRLPLPYGYESVFEKNSGNTTYQIYENQYALPLGYTYDSVTSESDADSLSSIEKQELTMLSAVVEDDTAEESSNVKEVSSLPITAKRLDNVTVSAGGDVLFWNDEITAKAAENAETAETLDVNGTTLKNRTENVAAKLKAESVSTSDDVEIVGNQIIIGSGGGSISFDFEGEPNSETYIVLTGDMIAEKDASDHFIEMTVSTGDSSKNYRFRADTYATGQAERVYSIGYHEKRTKHVIWTFENAGTITFDDIAVYSQSMDTYEERVNALKENSLENAHVDKNTVTGTITADSDKVLVLSIPYQSGWTAYVDGEEVPLYRANYQYMGLNISKGTHEIRLHYRIPGLKMVAILTGAGLVIFLVIIILNLILKRRRGKREV